MPQFNQFQDQRIPKRTKTIKVEIRTWDSLKARKQEYESFDDVIKGLLNQRSKTVGDQNIKAIKYERKIAFFSASLYGETVGVECEYNESKANKPDFVLDINIKKIFFGKKTFNPSEFFGVDNTHKHYSSFFMYVYLKA